MFTVNRLEAKNRGGGGEEKEEAVNCDEKEERIDGLLIFIIKSQIHRKREGETDRQADRQIDKQRDRQRQTDRQSFSNIHNVHDTYSVSTPRRTEAKRNDKMTRRGSSRQRPTRHVTERRKKNRK